MAVNWLQNWLITNNELLDPVLFFRSVVLVAQWLERLPGFVGLISRLGLRDFLSLQNV